MPDVPPVSDAVSDAALLHELTPVAERLFERHLGLAKEWFPHAYVPWSRGRDFVEGEEWDPDECPLAPAVRSALFVNLLTEDNLPYYFETIDRVFGPVDTAQARAGRLSLAERDVWQTCSRRWTAEENPHAIVILHYLTVTRALAPAHPHPPPPPQLPPP